MFDSKNVSNINKINPSSLIVNRYINRFRFTLSVQYIFILLFSFFALSINTTGFDFYHHALAQRSWEDIIGLNGVWSFAGLAEVPRYLLGGHILYVLSFGIIPVAWVVVVLHAVMVNKALQYSAAFGSLTCLTVAGFLAYNLIFMSFNGLSFIALLIAVLAFRLGKAWKMWLFLTAAFHPLGFMSVVIITFFYFSKSRSFLVLVAVVFLSIVVGCCNDGVYGVRNLIDQFDLYMTAALGRGLLVLLFFMLPLFFFVMKKMFQVKVANIPSIPLVHSYSLIAASLLAAIIIGWESQFSRASFLSYVIEDHENAQKNNIICAAWVSRDCYDLIDYSDLSFRQALL